MSDGCRLRGGRSRQSRGGGAAAFAYNGAPSQISPPE